MSIPLRPLGQVKQGHNHADIFQYDALQSRTEFRLLRLHAGKGATINSSLHRHTLGSASCPSYRALSYTWGKDAARFDIRLDGQVFKVRKNLRDALQSLRDTKSDCWLWIDAICINQKFDGERNHQLKLMADIYRNANVVLAWLSSAGESVKVANAFDLLRTLHSHIERGRSIYDYMQTHSDEGQWQSLQSLCELRYWTRKWIIQELIMARTVVLQMGSATCPMAYLENLCEQLQHDKGRGFSTHTSKNRVFATPAARLALQRSESSANQRPGLLYELTERYSSNECGEPCDHVYALYSLIGDHRSNFEVDYAASAVERLVSVLEFVSVHERLPPRKVLDFAKLLVRLFKITNEDLLREWDLLEDLEIVVPFTILGSVQLKPESGSSIAMREWVDPLEPTPLFSLDTSQEPWALTAKKDLSACDQPVGRPDMIYFSISHSKFSGLSACRIEEDDMIWHFPGTQLVFAVRQHADRTATILGRAYLFYDDEAKGTPKFWLHGELNYHAIRKVETQVSMVLATMLELDSYAMAATIAGEKRSRIDKTKAVLSSYWSYKVVIVCSVIIITFMLATILLQVVKQHPRQR